AQEVPKQKPRAPQSYELDPYKAYLKQRIDDGVLNCMVLRRELREQGYAGGYTILKDFVKPFRSWRKAPDVTVRFETCPGEQTQVDFGHFSYRTRMATAARFGPSSWCSAGPRPSTFSLCS